MAIDPTNPTILYAGINAMGVDIVGGVVFKTTDGGESWSLLEGFGDHIVNDIEIDPQNTSTVYAATEDGVFKSINGGDTWFDPQTSLFSNGSTVGNNGNVFPLVPAVNRIVDLAIGDPSPP